MVENVRYGRDVVAVQGEDRSAVPAVEVSPDQTTKLKTPDTYTDERRK